jgi:hypothetical protein
MNYNINKSETFRRSQLHWRVFKKFGNYCDHKFEILDARNDEKLRKARICVAPLLINFRWISDAKSRPTSKVSDIDEINQKSSNDNNVDIL